jgi:hypothetical protein
LSSSDITSWSFVITNAAGGQVSAYSSVDSGASTNVVGTVTASATEITIANAVSGANGLQLSGPTDQYQMGWEQTSGQVSGMKFYQLTLDFIAPNTGYTFSEPGPNSFTIASAAPEPASLTLCGVGAVALCGYHWRRRTR